MILRPFEVADTVPALSVPSFLSGKPPSAPAAFAEQIEALGAAFDGKVGISVHSINDGWSAGFAADQPFPQQSVRKLWTAAAILDAVDRGDVALDEPVTMTAADLSVFHQPIRDKIMGGAYDTTFAELLELAMTQSDNAANDRLYRRAGGEDHIAAFLADKGLAGIAIGPDERTMQSAMAGVEWNDAYSYGRAFWRAREALPRSEREAALARYLADPADGARPAAITAALTKLAKGELLSKTSTAYLIDLMARSKTGPERLRGGLAEAAGWSLAHKTGTGQVLGSFATAYNDVGILRSPGGRTYAVAVMVGSTRAPVAVRKDLMQAVTRSIVALEAGRDMAGADR
jgi:beta-lactamase class A